MTSAIIILTFVVVGLMPNGQLGMKGVMNRESSIAACERDVAGFSAAARTVPHVLQIAHKCEVLPLHTVVHPLVLPPND